MNSSRPNRSCPQCEQPLSADAPEGAVSRMPHARGARDHADAGSFEAVGSTS